MSKSKLVKRWIKIGNAYIMRKIHRLFVKREILEKVIKEINGCHKFDFFGKMW